MAEILNQQYQSVFTTPRQLPQDTASQLENAQLLTDITIRKEDIISAIKSIHSSSAPGPDGITPQLLKDYVNELAEPLEALGRKSLDEGETPDGTNLAFITPIFKGGHKSEPVN